MQTSMAQFGVSIAEAREFVLSNLDHPGMLAGMAFQHGITLDILAQIVGGGLTGLEIAQFFAAHDISAASLEVLPMGDALDASTAGHLAAMGVSREEVRDFIFTKLDELHALVDVAHEHGVSGEMVADIMGGGQIGQAIAQMVRSAMEVPAQAQVELVAVASAEAAAAIG